MNTKKKPTKPKPTITQEKPQGPEVAQTTQGTGEISDWGAALVRHEKGQRKGELVSCPANAQTILTCDPNWRGVLAWDEFAGCPVTLTAPPWDAQDRPATVKPAHWTDADTTRLRASMARSRQRLVLGKEDMNAAVDAAALTRVVHPVREYLRSCAPDETVTFDTWLVDYCGAEDTPLVRAIGAAWMISAVARVMRPGEQVDHMLVLCGGQGAGKSSAIRALVPNPDWFNDEFDPSTKDGKLALRGVWIVEASELAGLKRAEIETIKGAVTRRVDKYRDPYGYRDTRYARQCVLAGSTNAEQFLKDDTGDRRYWPVAVVGKMNVAGLIAARDALWAEAFARFEKGVLWHFTRKELQDAAKEQQEARRIVDPRQEIVERWLAGYHSEAGVKTPRRERGVTVQEALCDDGALAMPRDRATKPMEMDAAALLRKCGWVKCSTRHWRGPARVWLYYLPKEGCPQCKAKRTTTTSANGTASNAAPPEPEREREKEVRQVGQVGHASGNAKESGVQPQEGVVGQVGHWNGLFGDSFGFIAAAPPALPARALSIGSLKGPEVSSHGSTALTTSRAPTPVRRT
jgi:hypothetical protein